MLGGSIPAVFFWGVDQPERGLTQITKLSAWLSSGSDWVYISDSDSSDNDVGGSGGSDGCGGGDNASSCTPRG